MTEREAARDPQLSVIIPNWNGASLLPSCLESLRQQTYDDFEIVVVDNASTDESLDLLSREYPEVQVVPLTENHGFAGGCNAGITASRGDLLFILNNDTELAPNCLAAVADTATRYPKAGSIAPRIMLYDQRNILNSAGDLYRKDGTPDSRGVWNEYGPPYDEERYVFGGSGGAVAYRRAMLEDVGLFEEDFFMYCEDVDLNWRAQLKGWKCIYTPQAVIYHRLSASGGGSLSSFFVGRNTLWVLVRDYPTALLKQHWHAIVRRQIKIAWEALRNGRGAAARARLRGQLAGLFTGLRWLEARRRIQSNARANDAYIETILS